VTPVLTVDPDRPNPEVIARAAERLRAGGLVAFPTETVYGLGVNAMDRVAVRRLFEAKGRPATDPLIVHLADVHTIAALVLHVPEDVTRLASRFWPGPLTVVLPRSGDVPDEVTAGLDTVAIRIPRHPVAHAVLSAAAIPIAAPSANLFSRPSPTSAAHVLDDLDGRIDLIIDGGVTTVGVESTVLDLTRTVPTILRPGAVTREMLLDVLPRIDEYVAASSSVDPQRAPGMLEKHYSPRTPLTLYEGANALTSLNKDAQQALNAGERIGLLVASGDLEHDTTLTDRCAVREVGPDAAEIARHLYASLRELDAAGLDRILARGFYLDSGLGDAIADRLRRAAAGRIVRT
jgi:L-threonylcarbamoyladenylate synthase